MANIAAVDISSATGNNLFKLKKEANMDIMENIGHATKILLDLKTEVPVQDRWRVVYFNKFLT